jgi:hypothetical protein
MNANIKADLYHTAHQSQCRKFLRCRLFFGQDEKRSTQAHITALSDRSFGSAFDSLESKGQRMRLRRNGECDGAPSLERKKAVFPRVKT